MITINWWRWYDFYYIDRISITQYISINQRIIRSRQSSLKTIIQFVQIANRANLVIQPIKSSSPTINEKHKYRRKQSSGGCERGGQPSDKLKLILMGGRWVTRWGFPKHMRGCSFPTCCFCICRGVERPCGAFRWGNMWPHKNPDHGWAASRSPPRWPGWPL